MFALQGPARQPHQNRQLAAYLAVIAGFVNTAGFLLVGTFTSHVTGNTAQVANDLAQQQPGAAGRALLLVFAFFAGAFLANLLLQSNSRRAHRYALLFAIEAALIVAFLLCVKAGLLSPTFDAAFLCMAMGLQNSLMTLISDTRVRTTHMTGVVTDLAIEAARWVRSRFAGQGNGPDRSTFLLLISIFGGFIGGSAAGAEAVQLLAEQALWAPALAAIAAAIFAARSQRTAP